MALRLRVVGNQSRVMGDSVTRVFGVHGGTIGRAGDNDWILPDPERYISGHHARIEYRGGRYILTDTSSNGTYVNESIDPMSATGPYELKDGDRLRMGEFDFVVTIDESNDFPPEKSAIVTYDGVPSSSARAATENDIGASLNLDHLLSTDASTSGSRITPVNAYGQAIDLDPPTQPRKASKPAAPKPVAAPRPVPAAPPEEAVNEGQTQVPWNLATRRIEPYRNPRRAAEPAPAKAAPESAPVRVESPQPAPAAQAAPAPSDIAALQALCRGAGIDFSTIPVHMHAHVLVIAGQVLREAMFGLMDTLQGRTELRNRFRIAQTTIQPSENNPLNFSAGVEEGLRKLFEQRGGRYLGPVDAVRDGFRELKAHQQAMAAAMEVAFAEVMTRLDPAELQERFDRGLKRGGLLGATNKMKYWDLYTELFQSFGVNRQGDLPHLFVEEFARAYEAKITEIAARQQRSNGRKDEAVSG